MIPVVLDANIFLRSADRNSAQHPVAKATVGMLTATGHELFCFEQTCNEFWTAATRPLVNNGLGLTPAQCEFELAKLLVPFPLLEDKPGLFAEWRKLVNTHSISGKHAHDARYVAGMKTYGITHILSFNVTDFARFPDITTLDPVAIAATITP